MKKTLTITLHNHNNCGSALQSYALQQFLVNNNIQNEIIDYRPTYKKSMKEKIKTIIKHLLYFNSIKKQNNMFSNFREEYLTLTKRKYKNFNQLSKEEFSADYFITGSDQLWNMMYNCGNDDTYYLSFTKGNKISYSVSFGRGIIPKDNLIKVKKLCNDYKWISLREESSVAQLSEYVHCDIDYVCDPTLLLDKNDYKKLELKSELKDKYIFVYLAQGVDTQKINRILNNVRKKYPYKIVYGGTLHPQCICDINVKDINPQRFLTLISNAEFVVSNSFHATVFSLIYSKQFFTVLPPENSERVLSLYKQVGLYYEGIDTSEEIKEISDIMFKSIDKKIDEFRTRSASLLIKKINE